MGPKSQPYKPQISYKPSPSIPQPVYSYPKQTYTQPKVVYSQPTYNLPKVTYAQPSYTQPKVTYPQPKPVKIVSPSYNPNTIVSSYKPVADSEEEAEGDYSAYPYPYQ